MQSWLLCGGFFPFDCSRSCSNHRKTIGNKNHEKSIMLSKRRMNLSHIVACFCVVLHAFGFTNHLGAMSMMRPVLDPLTLGGIADFIKSGRCKSIFFLTGAGVSTGAGIPDFRSPGGMYDSLRPELLTATEPQRRLMRRDPVHVVTKEMFFQNPFPYMEVRRPFILGVQSQKWKATLSHWFMKFLDEEGLLKRVFTQNIDGLDYQTGIRRELVTNVHGSIANVSCEGCGRRMSFDAFCDKVRSQIKERGALENHDSTAGRKFW